MSQKVAGGKVLEKKFVYDKVFGQKDTQRYLFESSVEPLVDEVCR